MQALRASLLSQRVADANARPLKGVAPRARGAAAASGRARERAAQDTRRQPMSRPVGVVAALRRSCTVGLARHLVSALRLVPRHRHVDAPTH
eukprot:scaffold61883_cov36-Phaeocystis_antarctica.AAC.1